MGEGEFPHDRKLRGERNPIVHNNRARVSFERAPVSNHQARLTYLAVAIAVVTGFRAEPAIRLEGNARTSSRIDSIAVIVVGKEDGGEFSQVVGGILWDSTIVVGEASTGAISFFRRSAGTLERAIGRLGQGPGEFAQVTWMQRRGVELYVNDAVLNRISRFSSTGEYRGAITIQRPEGFATTAAIGVFEDGSMLISGVPRRERVRTGTVVQARMLLMRFDSGGGFVDSLGWISATETFVEPFGRAGEMVTKLVFGREVAITVMGGQYVIAPNADDGLVRYDRNGRVLGRMTPAVRRPATPVTRLDVKEGRQRFVAKGLGGVDVGAIFDRMPIPDSFPPYGWAGEHWAPLLRNTSDGNLWALHFGGVRDKRPTWSVFKADGTFLHEVVGYGEMRLLDAANGMALVLTWDKDGAEQVELRRILP